VVAVESSALTAVWKYEIQLKAGSEMNTSDKQRDVENEIENLVRSGANTDDLLALLGEEDGALFASPSEKKVRGLRLFRNALERVQEQICANAFLRAYGESESIQRKALAIAAIMDFLGTKGAATAALLIAHVGLDNVCAGRWEQHVK
jgi:hypothetical protein